MSEQPSQDPHAPQEPDSRRPAMVGLIVVLLLIVGGLFLVHVLRSMGQIQDCALEGRSNCAPAGTSGSGGG